MKKYEVTLNFMAWKQEIIKVRADNEDQAICMAIKQIEDDFGAEHVRAEIKSK